MAPRVGCGASHARLLRHPPIVLVTQRRCSGPLAAEAPLRDLAICPWCGSDAASLGQRGKSHPTPCAKALQSSHKAAHGRRRGSLLRPHGLLALLKERCIPWVARWIFPFSSRPSHNKPPPAPSRRVGGAAATLRPPDDQFVFPTNENNYSKIVPFLMFLTINLKMKFLQ